MTAPLSALEATARDASVHPLARARVRRALFAVTVRLPDHTMATVYTDEMPDGGAIAHEYAVALAGERVTVTQLYVVEMEEVA